MNEVRTRVGDLGDVPWWAHGASSIAALLATTSLARTGRVPYSALAWLGVVAIMSFAVALSRRARPGDAYPRIERRSRPQGAHGTGWWLLLHVTMVAAGAAPFLWFATSSSVGSEGLPWVAVTSAAVGLLFGTRSGLTISIACSAGALALAGAADDTTSSWSFSADLPVWLRLGSVVSLLFACALIARLGLAELATAPNIPQPFAAPASNRRGEGLFRVPDRRSVFAAVAITGACVAIASIIEPFVEPTTKRLSEATADRITQATGGGAFNGPGDGSSVFRGASGRDRGAGNVLGANDSFEIDEFGATSDAEVLRVRVTQDGLPGTTDFGSVLLKGQSFDQWDGRRWFSSAEVVRSIEPLELTFPPGLDPSRSSQVLVTWVELRRGSTNLLFAPSRIAQVDLASQSLLLKADESVVTSRAMGPGTTYAAFSARNLVRDTAPDVPRAALIGNLDDMRADGVTGSHLDLSSMSDRTRALAADLGAGQTSIQGVVREVELWLAANTVYDFTARQRAGKGTDVVDDFLFDSQAGWCEQVATSTVMLLRANGIPARLATGYLPSTRLPDGRFSVLGRDAHAWVEYYLPGYGWAERDPTRLVPIRNLPPPVSEVTDSRLPLRTLLLVFGAVLLISGLVIVLRSLRSSRRDLSPVERRIQTLMQFGAEREIPRAPGQTLGEYAEVLEARLGSPAGAVAAAALLERERFDPHADGSSLQQVDALVGELSAAHPSADRRSGR
jgi:hypothetical protein